MAFSPRNPKQKIVQARRLPAGFMHSFLFAEVQTEATVTKRIVSLEPKFEKSSYSCTDFRG